MGGEGGGQRSNIILCNVDDQLLTKHQQREKGRGQNCKQEFLYPRPLPPLLGDFAKNWKNLAEFGKTKILTFYSQIVKKMMILL